MGQDLHCVQSEDVRKPGKSIASQAPEFRRPESRTGIHYYSGSPLSDAAIIDKKKKSARKEIFIFFSL